MSKCNCSHTEENKECCCHEEHSSKCRCEEDTECSSHSEHNSKCEDVVGCSCGCCSCTEHSESEEKAKRTALVAGTVIFVGAIIFQLLKIPIAPTILYIAAYLTVGFGTFRELFEAIREGEIFGENTLMTVSSVGAMIIGEMAEGCTVMLLFALGEMLEHKAQKRSKRNIEQLLALKPKNAVRITPDGKREAVSPEKLSVGDIVEVHAGDTIPCDGEIIEGTANTDTASITGESTPRLSEVGDAVRCGYISLDGALKIRVTASYADNTFSKILGIISNSSERKSRSEGFVKKFARIYTPAVMALAIFVAFVGGAVTGDFNAWIYKGLVLLATSCPCAFVISVPLTFFFGIGELSKIGLLVKGSEYVERLSKVKAVAFDKTGTITKGELRVSSISVAEGFTEEEVLSLCASVEASSNHPIAKRIVGYAQEKAVSLSPVLDAREIAGRGMVAFVDGAKIACGNEKLMSSKPSFELSGNTTKVYVEKDDTPVGVIELSDEIKPEAKETVEALSRLGVTKTVMLTGDSCVNASEVAKRCGIAEVHSDLEPQEKSGILENIIKETEGNCAFVGDGINDAPVLAVADIGIAVGGSGAEISVETADAVILGTSLTALPKGISAARTIMSRVKFNVIFAIGIKLAIMLLTLLGYANMGLAVFGDVGVTIIVILNSLRKIAK